MAQLHSLVLPCEKGWLHSVMMPPPVIKTQKMGKTNTNLSYSQDFFTMFPLWFLTPFYKLCKTQGNTAKYTMDTKPTASTDGYCTNTRTLAASSYKHSSLPFQNITQCKPQCVHGSSLPGPPALLHVSYSSLSVGFTCYFICMYLQTISQLEEALCIGEGDSL